MERYAPALLENGIDDLDTLKALSASDLSGLGMVIGHIRKVEKLKGGK